MPEVSSQVLPVHLSSAVEHQATVSSMCGRMDGSWQGHTSNVTVPEPHRVYIQLSHRAPASVSPLDRLTSQSPPSSTLRRRLQCQAVAMLQASAAFHPIVHCLPPEPRTPAAVPRNGSAAASNGCSLKRLPPHAPLP